MKVQIIEREGKPEYAVLPYADYLALTEKAEMAMDLTAFDAALAKPEETLPHESVRRLLAGESPCKVWREHRGLTQAELAQAAGLSQPAIAQIESGQRKPGVAALQKLAKALGLDMDDLVDESAQ